MKAIFVEKTKSKKVDIRESNFEKELLSLLSEFQVLESHIVYFSAGDSKIKEILVKKEPSYSA